MSDNQRPKRRLALFIPLAAFMLFATIALIRITSNNPDTANSLPNALAGQEAPQTQLPILALREPTSEIFDPAQFKGRVTLVNFWGSWCPPCREEHPQLLTLAQDSRFDLVGVNFKDNQENATRFLGAFGNPFKIIGFDPRGRAAIEWGVYGPPETFILNREGKIVFKHIGPIMPDNLAKTLMPEIEKALQ
ncbi:DsbE family thiol:disulfide interchange protein [Bartonella sp. HY038]|uniref:DsbE family thiol:disulfide interchange protein n=1 Tax=Bartonella sp. HY038 TaxID=2759660 RepID=UPI0015FBDC5B|nr:DsbE family thiol:disulfide interchange protein [Bartonella sp. HY038]